MGFIVSDGRPWDGSDEKPVDTSLRSTKVEEWLVVRAKIIAKHRGIKLSDYISDLLSERLDADWSSFVQEKVSALTAWEEGEY